MKKVYSVLIMLTMMVTALGISSCGSGEDEYAIEDALQKEWDISNSNSAVGAVDCNVFSVKVDKVEGDTVYVSYSLKSKYASGDTQFVKLTGAKLIKDGNGNYTVESTGY
jgi:hypothetical protein